MSGIPIKPPCIKISEWSAAHGFFGLYRDKDQSAEFSGGNAKTSPSTEITLNRSIALESIGLNGPGYMGKQSHTTTVLEIPKDHDKLLFAADALVTKAKNVAIGILTADCGPILFYDPVMHIIGAAHAGWRGAVYGILENTMHAMFDLGARPETLQAAIGPMIQKKSYVVSPDFIEHIQKETPWDIAPMTEIRGDIHYFDLPMYIYTRLRQKIGCIYDTKIDTFGSSFFSHRWALFQKTDATKEKEGGRNMSWIGLTD